MQQKISVIVYADNEKAAVYEAKLIFDKLTQKNIFTGYTTPLEATLADLKNGKKTIREGMKNTKRIFIENIAELRMALRLYNNEYLFKNNFIKDKDGKTFQPRYAAILIGQRQGPAIYLYDHEGEGIRTPKHLKNALTKWACNYKKCPELNPYQNNQAWVVSTEATY